MNKRALFAAIGCYLIWGLMPLYWALLGELDALFVLAARIFFAAVFTCLILLGQKRLRELPALLRDKPKMKFLAPAALVITLNWGLYIWAMANNHVMDASLGYYMNPLAVFLCGMIVFKEKCGKLELVSLLLAAAGVLLSAIQYGAFPFMALTLAITFALYGTLKKKAQVGGILSVCAETLITAPLALLFLLFAPISQAVYPSLTLSTTLLVIGTGIASALPLMLYGYGVTRLPFITMGFLQYISPTGMLITGLILGEPFSAGQAVSFGFIWAGLILFTVSMVQKEKKRKLAEVEGL